MDQEEPNGLVGALALLVTLGGIALWVSMLAGPWMLVGGLLDGRDHLDTARKSLEAGRLKEARYATLAGLADAERAREGLQSDSPLMDVLRVVPLVDEAMMETDHLVAALEFSASAAEGSLDIAQNALRGPDKLVVRDPDDPEGGSEIRLDRLDEVGNTISEIRTDIGKASEELQAVDLAHLPKRMHKPLKRAITQAEDADRTLAEAEAGFEVLPGILGADGPRNYLVGMQNSAELRGTGGSILRFARLRFDRGSAELITQGSVYDVDKNRRPVSIPLPEDAWYVAGIEDAQRFGNSNWSPDWPLSAQIMIDYARAVDEKMPPIDGFIAVDPVVLYDLLPGVGRVETSGGRAISQSNVEHFLLYKAYAQFPNTGDRRAVLKQAVNAFFAKLLKPAHPTDLAEGMGHSLSTKNMQIWMADPEEQGFIEFMGWDAAIDPARGSDYFMVVQQNVGGNKLNYVEKQEHELDIDVAGSDVMVKAEIRSFNDVYLPAPRYWEGNSEAYHRPMFNVYVQSDSELLASSAPDTCVVLRGDRPCRGDAFAGGLAAWPEGRPPEHYERGKKVWSAALEIPPRQEASWLLEYLVPDVVKQKDGRFTYRLVLQHQPKPNPEDVTIRFHLPEDARSIEAPGWKRDGKNLVWSKSLNKDVELEVSWQS